MLDYVSTPTIFISPRKSDKEYKLVYEYFNIYYPLGWVIYLEGANPPEILLMGGGAFKTNKYFDLIEAKSRLQQLEEEMLKVKEVYNE